MFTAALIIPLVLPPVSVGAGWVVMMDVQFGVLNYLLSLVGIEPLLWLADDRTALPAIMLIDIWQSSMFVFILMYAGILSLPQDPYEAAAIDGASPWQIFRDVTIPLLRPTFVVILLLRTLDAARIADRMLVMTRGGPGSSTETVVLSIYKYAFIHFNFGYASALSVMFQVFLIILATFYIRRILRA
jgi:multiple sugar transport system permease protein